MPPDEIEPALRELRAARDTMEQAAMSAISAGRDPAGRGDPAAPGAATGTSTTGYVSSLEPSFRAQELSFATSAVAANIQLAVAARERTWWQQLLGRQPAGAGGALSSAQERAGAHVQRHSVWLHNSVRGAIALGLAVLVADLTWPRGAASAFGEAVMASHGAASRRPAGSPAWPAPGLR